MMTKLMQEAVTEVASCGVIRLPTSWIFLAGSLMMLAKAAYTASLYTITPIMQASIKQICGGAHTREAADSTLTLDTQGAAHMLFTYPE